MDVSSWLSGNKGTETRIRRKEANKKTFIAELFSKGDVGGGWGASIPITIDCLFFLIESFLLFLDQKKLYLFFLFISIKVEGDREFH